MGCFKNHQAGFCIHRATDKRLKAMQDATPLKPIVPASAGRRQLWRPAICRFCAEMGVTTPMQVCQDTPPEGEAAHWVLRCPIHVENDHVVLVALNAQPVTRREIEVPAV